MLVLLIYYLWLGAMFAMVVDLSTWYARKRGVAVPASAEWSHTTRLLAILIWPIGIISFLAGLITTIIKKNNKDE
jgi:hypothetical protein|tara:strand:+ start:230 stop:454 length:225 start_codon:yes stop_codon:yes gene_type:complete